MFIADTTGLCAQFVIPKRWKSVYVRAEKGKIIMKEGEATKVDIQHKETGEGFAGCTEAGDYFIFHAPARKLVDQNLPIMRHAEFALPKTHYETVQDANRRAGRMGSNDASADSCAKSPQPAAKRYVQHMSGNGEKWEVQEKPIVMAFGEEWIVHDRLRVGWHALPKSEYPLCKPEKRWVDVTADCFLFCGSLVHCQAGGNLFPIIGRDGYRLRNVVRRDLRNGVSEDCSCLIVEHEEEVPHGV